MKITNNSKDQKEIKFPNKNERFKYNLGYHLVPDFIYKILRKVRVIK